MRHGSLFSGIGGFDLAAEWMGWENMFHCEWNQFGQKVLKYYWPNAVSYDDICKTDFTIWRGRIDILTGGFPCQPYSMAGKRQGTEDARHLWPEMLRAIRECRPTWIVGENVPGLINWSGGLVFEQVCADLEGEGYEVQPVVLPASGVNAPHRRDRVWFVAKRTRRSDILGNGFIEDTNYRGGRRQEGLGEYDLRRSKSEEQDNNIEPTDSGYIERPTQNPNENGRGGDETIISDTENIRSHRTEEVGRERKEYITHNGDGIRGTLNEHGTGGVTTNANNIGQPRKEHGQTEPGRFAKKSIPTDWTDWPTVAPLRHGNDGVSSRLDGITFPKWRNESIKAGGNAIVPQVALQIFKVIEQMQNT